MAKLTTTRKTRFAAALALRGMTQRDWAIQSGRHPSYVSMVMNGKAESHRLFAEIDAFIEDTESRRKILVA